MGRGVFILPKMVPYRSKLCSDRYLLKMDEKKIGVYDVTAQKQNCIMVYGASAVIEYERRYWKNRAYHPLRVFVT